MSDELSVLENVSVRWVHHTSPDKFGKYSIFAVLNPEHVNQMMEQGISNFKEYEGDPAYSFTRNTVKKDGSRAKTMAVFDQDRNPVEGRVNNGALADIYYNASTWNVNGKSGVKGQFAFMVLK